MKYTKPALSFEQQADQLLQRGFQADRAKLIETLSRVSYYRLSAYWYPFKRADEPFVPGTTLEKVWRRYIFDRQLRLLVMDAIERVEVVSSSQSLLLRTDVQGRVRTAPDPRSTAGHSPGV